MLQHVLSFLSLVRDLAASGWLRAVGLAVMVVSMLSSCSAGLDGSEGTEQSAQFVTTAVVRVNSGGNAVAPFQADQYATGGNSYTSANAISTSGVSNAAPAAVYQSERYGNFSYTVGGLTANAPYTVRLHFAEIYWNAAGARVFNVVVNGVPALTNFDIYAVAGANKAVVRDVPTTASGSGQITIQYVTVKDNAKSSGFEILSDATTPDAGSTPDAGPPPAAYQVNSGGGSVGAFAADEFASGGSTYSSGASVSTAGVSGAAPAAVYQSERYGSFSYVVPGLVPNAGYTVRLHFAEVYWNSAGSRVFNVLVNGTQVLTNFDIYAVAGANKAVVREVSATASSSGQITIQYVTVKDNAKSSGFEILSSAGVSQTLTSVVVSPTSAQVAPGGTQSFAATALDQFGKPMVPQPSFSWTTSAGSINSSGLFTAPSSAGQVTVTAATGAKSASATVNVVAGASYTTNFNLTESPISESGVWFSGLDPLQTPVATANGLAFGTQTGQEANSGNYNDSSAYLSGFPANQRASAVIHKASGISGSAYQEVELLLRWSVGPLRTGLPFGDTHSYGYEINLAYNGAYVQIGRFKETPALFDSTSQGSPVTSLGVQDGDIFAAQIVGNTITATLTRNGVTTVIASATDNTGSPFTSGGPGIGFFRQTLSGGTTNPQSFCFTSFTATSL